MKILNKEFDINKLKQTKSSNKNLFNNCTIISGKIESKTKDITKINFNDTKLNFKSKDIVGEIGDEVHFEVLSNSKDNLVIRQIIDSKLNNESQNLIPIINIKDLYVKSDLINSIDEDKNYLKEKVKEQIKEQIALSKVKRSINFMKGNVNIINQLVGSGINLNKIDLSTLNVAIAETKDATLQNSENLLHMFEKIKNLSNNAVTEIIKSDKPITIENVYKHHNLSDQKTNYDNLDDLDHLDKDITNLLKNIDIKNTEQNIKISKLFINKNINLNQINFNRFELLKNIDKNITVKDLEPEQINCIVNDTSFNDIDLEKIYNTKKLFAQNTNTLKTKKDILHLQLKLTSEAVYKLSEKNLDINTLPIKTLIKEIDKLEADNYIKNFKIAGATQITEENLKNINSFFKDLKNINLDLKTYDNILKNKIDFSLVSICNSYESNQTEVSKKYGDNFNNILDDVKKYLTSINLNPTEDNIKAVKVLNYNNIETSHLNILKITNIDNKINNLLEKLTPNIVAKLIKEGLDPTKLHVDELLEYANEYEKAYGFSDIDKVLESIYQMDKKQDDSYNRDAIISFYKMMHSIRKNNTSSIGKLINNEYEPTISNLYSLSKTYSENDYLLDDDFMIKATNNNLKQIIENAIKEKENAIPKNIMSHINNIISKNNTKKTLFNLNILTELNNINDLDFNKAINYDFVLGKISNNIQQYNTNIKNKNLDKITLKYTEDNADKLLAYNDIKNINPKNIKLLRDNKIKDTLKNISLLDKDFVLDNTDLQDDYLDDFIKSLKIKDILDKKSYDKKSYDKSLNIPIKINGEVKNLKMLVINSDYAKKDCIQLVLNLDTNNLGNINFTINLESDLLNLKIKASKDTTAFIKNNESTLKELLDDYNISSIIYDEVRDV